MHWVKFLPGAWLSGTRALSNLEKAVYIDLLMVLYDRDGNVPNDDNVICRLLQRNPRTWRKARDGLVQKGKIHLLGNRWTANRVEFELNSARIRVELSSNKSENPTKTTVNALSRARDIEHYTKKDTYLLSERVRAGSSSSVGEPSSSPADNERPARRLSNSQVIAEAMARKNGGGGHAH